MQVCTSLQTDNHASTPPLCFLQAGCPSCRPTNSVKALKALPAIILPKQKNYRSRNVSARAHRYAYTYIRMHRQTQKQCLQPHLYDGKRHCESTKKTLWSMISRSVAVGRWSRQQPVPGLFSSRPWCWTSAVPTDERTALPAPRTTSRHATPVKSACRSLTLP